MLECCPGLALDKTGLCRCICICNSLRKCKLSSFYKNCISIVWSCIEQEPQFSPLTQHFTLYKDGWVGVGTTPPPPPPQEMAEIAVKWHGYSRWMQTPESNPMASALSSTQILRVLFAFIPFPVSVRRNPDRSNLGGKRVYVGSMMQISIIAEKSLWEELRDADHLCNQQGMHVLFST